MYSESLVKINIGSGPHGKPNWINLDWGILPLLSKMPRLAKTFIAINVNLVRFKQMGAKVFYGSKATKGNKE